MTTFLDGGVQLGSEWDLGFFFFLLRDSHDSVLAFKSICLLFSSVRGSAEEAPWWGLVSKSEDPKHSGRMALSW